MDTEPNSHSSSSTNDLHKETPTEKIFDCSYPNCDYQSLLMENVCCHEKAHDHDPSKRWDIPCEVCPEIFGSLVSFFYHMSSQHSSKLLCPWCLFSGEDLSEYKTHIHAHSGTPSISTGPSNSKNVRNFNKTQTPKYSRPKKTTTRTSRFCCGTCFKSFYHGSCLWRHKLIKHRNSNSSTNSVPKQLNFYGDSPGLVPGSECAKPTAARGTSVISSVEKTQSEGMAKNSIETVNIQGETFYCCTICSHKTKRKDNLKVHFLVHTERRPFGCLIEGCKYRAKSFQPLRIHSRIVHHINNLRLQKNAKTSSKNLGSSKECDSQRQENMSSSADFSIAFACLLCEFIGDSVLAALNHAQQHQRSSFRA